MLRIEQGKKYLNPVLGETYILANTGIIDSEILYNLIDIETGTRYFKEGKPLAHIKSYFTRNPDWVLA